MRAEAVSPQSDIYAFGILLFEMLSGRHPFQDAPITMLVMKHLQEPLPSIAEIRSDLPETIDTIIAKATAKDPDLRYASILALVAELKAAANLSEARSADSLPVKKVMQRTTPTTAEQRNRYAMLQNVRSFWIEGVLENSLHNAVMIEMGMKLDTGAVENPWNTLLRTPTGDAPLLRRTRPDAIVPLEHVVFSWRAVQWRNFALSFPFAVLTTPVFALMLFPNDVVVTVPRLLLSLSGGFVMALLINLYLDGFTASPIEMRLHPNEGMRATLQNMMWFSVVQIIAFGCVALAMASFGLPLDRLIRVWLAFVFMFGSDMMLSHGGIPLLQHVFLRYQLWRENLIPGNYAHFLDYAASLVLLRKVGGGYIFIHRYLLEYFAGLQPAKRD